MVLPHFLPGNLVEKAKIKNEINEEKNEVNPWVQIYP
jgi:hypothetical protein